MTRTKLIVLSLFIMGKDISVSNSENQKNMLIAMIVDPAMKVSSQVNSKKHGIWGPNEISYDVTYSFWNFICSYIAFTGFI